MPMPTSTVTIICVKSIIHDTANLNLYKFQYFLLEKNYRGGGG